jgi:hypothetical protein
MRWPKGIALTTLFYSFARTDIMAHQNKRPLGEILGAGKRRMERKPARPLKEIFGTGKELSKERTDTAVLSPADPGFWVPSDPWIGPEQEREPGWTPNFRGKKKLAFLEQSQRMMDGWQGERAAESMPASETVETLQTGAVSVPAEKTGRRMPVERFDVRGILNPTPVRSGVLLDPERSEAPAAGDMALPSGTVLRKSDRDLDEFFREQVMPGIEPMQAAADERARKVLTEQSEARDRRWLEHFNIDPVGDYVADAVRTAATSRSERGPARIVEEVLSGIDPGKANAYIADRLADDPEFAAAADRLQRVVPAGGEVSDEEIERLQTALSPAQRKQYDKAVSEEQKRIVGEQEAFQKAADAAWKRQAQQFQQGITERLVEEMARRNMPESELDAFTRIALNASVPGMLTEWTVSNAAGGDKALHAQIMQRALEKYDPSIASRIGGEVAGLLSSGPVFAAGGALGKAGAAGLRRIAERSVIKRLMARGITEGAEGVARRLVAGSPAQRLAQGLVASGTTLSTYDTVATPLAMAAAGENPSFGDIIGAMGRGFATGALLPGIGMATGRVADAATSRLGRYAAELGGFAAENAAFVGMGTLYDGLRTGEWGSPEQLAEDFAHSVGVLGIMKSVGALKRGRAKNPGFYDKVIAETEFTPEEVEALGRAGVDGRSYKRAVFDLLNAKETASGREVAERAAKQLGSQYADVMRSPEVPVSAKAKLMYLVEGRIPERLPLTTDVRRIVGEDGRTTVDLLDPAGNLVQRRAFSSEKAAEAFERESAGVREVNSIQYYEALIDRVQAFDEASQAYAVERGVPVETVKNEVRKAVGGQPYDKELVRRVVELSGQAGTGTVDVPGMLAAEIGRKHGLQEGEFEQALARREEVRTPEERAAVAEYAARLKEIATQELRQEPTPEERAERQLVEVAEQAITQAQNRDDGVVYTATMQDGRQANIIKGANLVYDPETGEVDATQSDPTVVVRYEDGEMRQVSVREIDMIVEAVSTDDARAEALKAIREQLDTAAREEALAEAVETGGLVQLKDGRIGAVEGVNEDGSFNVAVQDAEGRIVTGRVEAGDIVGPVEEESVPETVGSDGNAVPAAADAADPLVGRSLTDEEARQVIGQMEAAAEPAPELELTPENWVAEFGEEGKVQTPVGEVKMGENQLAKLFLKGRSAQFGMVKPTLETPDCVIEIPTQSKDGNTERPSSLLFVKAFTGKDGQKHYFFTSVTVQKDDMEVSVSNHLENRKRIIDFLKKGKLLYRVYGGAQTEQRPADVSVTASPSDMQGFSGEDTTTVPENQIAEAEIPRQKNGQPDFNAMPADMLAVELSAAVGHDKAVERLQVARGVNAKSLDKLRKSLDGMGDLNKAMAVEQQIAAMQQEDARLAGALEQLGAVEESVTGKAPAENFSKEIERLFPEGLPNVRARVLADIARGQRFVWNDSPDGTKRGVATELGFTGNESERRARFGMLGSEATGAKHVSSYVHDLWEDSNGYALDMDDAALRDEVIDVLLATPSRASAMAQLRDMAARHAEDDAAPRDAEDLAAMEAYDQERNNSRTEPVIAEQPGPDDVPFSVVGGASAAPAGVTPERWNVIVDQLRRVIGAENVVTDPEAVRAAYERIMGRGMEIRRRQVAEANERYNKQLDLFTEGKLPSGVKIDLGYPGVTLLACGIRNADMTIAQRVLKDHMEKHGLTADDIRNLPAALENPIMVYEWGDKAKTTIVITEIPRETERIAVALRFRQTVDGIKINKVVSVHGKSIDRLLTDMNTPLTDFGAENLKWVDKEKASDWLVTGGSFGPSASDQRLVTAVKIVTNFDNPKIGPENIVPQDKKTRYFRTPEGEVYGFTAGGKIYLDSERMNAATPMHEYTELWSQIVARENPELWMRGVELMKHTLVWDEVNADPNYKELSEELRVSETLSRIVADEFAGKQDAITDSSVLLGKLRAWMRKFWGFLKGTFAKWTKRELDDLTPKKFAQMPLRDFVEGIDLQKVRGPKPEPQRAAGHKQMQLEIIERYNPMRDDVHTGIRNIEDIKSFEEVVNEAKSEGDTAYPDIGLDMLEEAAKTGRITVYSSYPIKQGVFVSPSQMNAADYAGGGPVYRKEVSVDDVAWITSDEGQYAKVGSNSEARFSFIGERGAENLDKAEEASVRLDNLAAARSMETAGKDALAIKMATGWERGTDGKWRYEIPDIKVIRQPEMTVNRTEEGDVWYKTKLGKLIDATELFTAYPQLADIEVGIQTLPKGESGSYHNNVLILNIDTYKDKKEDVKKRIGEIERSAEYKEYSNVFDAEDATEAEMNMAMKKFFTSDIGKEYYDLMWGKGSTEKAFGKSARSVLSHEIQHAIQDIEGFARGGNLTIGERIAKQRDSLTDWQRNFIEDVAIYESLKDTMREDYPLSRFMRNTAADEARYGESISRDIMTMDDKELRREYNRLSQASRRVSPGEAYFNIAGEVEARNVQKRLGMSAEERLASLAEETEDVARKDQIILREALGGGAASLANAREFTERRVTTLEKLENKRDALIADRGNIANFDERLAAVDAEIEAYMQSDPVAETFGKDGAGDAHLQAVEDAVYDMQREINLPTQTVVVRNADEFIARLREMGATDEQLKGISPEHCPEGAQWRGEIVIRGDAVADKVHARVIYIHEQAHDITEALFTPDELYDAAEEMGADYMNKRLEERNASYHVDGNSVESMIQGANEMISRGVDLLYRKGLLAEFFATENGPIYPVIMYMEEHGVPSRLKDLIVENLQNIKADQYGTERTRQNIPGEVERQLDSRLFPAREGDGTADETGGRTGTAGDAVPERIGAGAAGVAADAGGRIGGRGRDLERPSFSFGDSRNDAPKLTKQQQLISDLRRAVRESKAAARSVAQIVSRRVRKEVGTDLVEIMGKREFDAIVRQIEEATARQEVEKPLQRIAEVVTDLEIKRLQKVVDDFLKLKVQGEGPRGVSVAKEVDDRTRRMFEIFRNNLDRPAAEVAGELREQEDADMLYDLDAVSALEAYQEAVRYGREVDEIDREVEALRARNTQLRRERIAANKAGRKELFELLKKQILYNNELIDALEAERVETKGHRAGALKETAGLLSGQIGAGREILSEWKKQEEERRKKIVNDAFRDVDDGSKIPVLDKRPGVWTQGYRRTVEFLLSPAYSMDYLLKTISVNAPKGEGALYDHFMRGTDGYVEARGRYYIGYEDFKRALDEKARAVFGKSYPEVVADSNVPTEATITITNAAPRKPERDKQKGTDAGNPERVAAAEEYNPTIGEALYIYMTNKMTDGQVKLKRMGITEEEVDALVGILPARYVQFADWLQNEFLPERRKTYNATHLAVFGTQMARIENYVPLKIQKSYVRQEVDGSEPDPDTLPSAITGSIIRRTRNNQILNLHTNALDLMLEHGQQMEHWNAFTRVVLDMNALLTSTKFRRMLDTRNPGLHKRLKVAAQLAADSYRPQANDVNRAWIALGKLAASSKIAFRVNTALKQVLSYPAFYAYSPNPKFWAQLTKNLAPTTWAKNFRWCIDNIPSFRERWLGRMAGNEKLAQMTAPLLDKWLDKMNKYGMMPNAFVDALTCANGAKAVYDFRRTEYMERGKSAAEAERMARIDAAVSINTTQQSSEGMYIGQMQADRDFWSVSMSTFQNSNFAYLRKQLEGIDELFRDTMRERRNRTEYYKEQGFSDDEASDLALKEVVEAKLGALFNIVVFMFGLNILWGLGNNVWKYLFAPETRDEIPGELAKSAFVAAVRNTTVGSLAEGFASGYGANPSVLLSDMISFTNRLWRIVKKENPDAWNETAAYLALQTLSANGLGIDLESFVNMYQGITGMIRDGVDVEDLMWILNAPQSQAKLLAGKPKEGETEEKYHERMIFIERRIAERVDKKRRDKWTRNYTAYRQAEALGIQAERDIYGNVTVPELKQLDAEYAAALKNSGVTAAGGMRTDYDWEGLTPEQKKRWQKRARMAWKINKEEKELDAVIVYNERYAERMRELMDRKREYMVDVENNK